MTVTVGTAAAAAARRLASAGIATARLDARLLLARALNVAPEAIVVHPNRPLEADAAVSLEILLARRERREPIAQILGVREFWSLSFGITGDVLVPRAETETVVEAALAHVGARGGALEVLDLGTGSGCLLLALLAELPAARGVGVDVSAAALLVARDNACRLGLAGRASFVAADWGDGLFGRFDLVVANPPYIADSDLAALAPEVRLHEPRGALSGGADGLAAYRALANRLPGLLAAGGRAVLEIGLGQVRPVAGIVSGAGMQVIETRDDLAGIPRAVVVAPGNFNGFRKN